MVPIEAALRKNVLQISPQCGLKTPEPVKTR
jgi:hypothetical protein